MPHTSFLSFLRATVVALTSIGMAILPSAQAVAATAAAPRTIGELKSAAAFRAEAASYDQAVRAIASIGNASLRTPADLQAADAIVRRNALTLRLLTSKLVAMAYEDPAFTLAITRNLSNEATARTFAKRITTDFKSVETLDGAPQLKKRMYELTRANADLLQKAASNLHAATVRITGNTQLVQPRYLPALTDPQWTALIVIILVVAALTFPPLILGIGTLLALSSPTAVAAFTSFQLTSYVVAFLGVIILSVLADQDGSAAERGASADAAVAACIEAAVERNEQCLREAGELPPAERLNAQIACTAYLAGEQALCSLAAPFY